jgi:hypothetical protein
MIRNKAKEILTIIPYLIKKWQAKDLSCLTMLRQVCVQMERTYYMLTSVCLNLEEINLIGDIIVLLLSPIS